MSSSSSLSSRAAKFSRNPEWFAVMMDSIRAAASSSSSDSDPQQRCEVHEKILQKEKLMKQN
jgi:hypothetical protein